MNDETKIDYAPEPETADAIDRLHKDLRKAAVTLTPDEARFLVDAYYTMQENRKRADNQILAMEAAGEPHGIISWLSANARVLENQIKSALDVYSGYQPLGKWARSVKGIGPVIAAGLLAHIDVAKAETAGAVWRFAGLDPTSKWDKGEKRPWNAALKTLCWKIGESFVKVHNADDAFYGRLYAERKALETERNERGDYKEQAEAGAKRVGKTTEAYKSYIIGKLPPGHIHARAKRYAVKLFLAHYHEKGRQLLGLPIPLPYPLAHLNHVHKIDVPE